MATISREMVNQYSTAVTDGRIPADLFIRDVPDFIPIIGRTDTPFTKQLKTGGAKNLLKWEFGSGDLVPNTTTLATALLDGTGTTVEFTDQNILQKWDHIYFKDTGEIIRLTEDPGATSNANVVRGVGSTAGAAHSAGAEVIVLGPAVPEGADSPSSPHAMGAVDYTFPQIFEYTWSTTHRGRVTPNYEVKTDRFRHEMKKKMKEAALDLEMTFIYGVRNQGDGSKTNPSSMGGIREFTTYNTTDLAGDPLELIDFLDTLQAMYMRVGQNDMAKHVFGPPFLKRVVNSFFLSTRRTGSNDTKLNLRTDTIDTDFGEIKFNIHYNWPSNEIHFLNMEDMRRHHYEGGNWSTGLFSTEGWYDKGFLRGDFGGIFEAPERRGAILDISTTAADYANLDKIA